MCMFCPWFAFLLIFKQTNGLFWNIDTNYIAVSEHLTSSEYFGYSLALYKTATEGPGILVGAPLFFDPINQIQSGEVYRCLKGRPCKRTLLGDHEINVNDTEKKKIDNAWIGGSMDISYGKEIEVVTCAYRYKSYIEIKTENYNRYYMNGACYIFLANTNDFRPLKVFQDSDDHELSGFSVHFGNKTNDTSSKRSPFLIGAPGKDMNLGKIAIVKDSKTFLLNGIYLILNRTANTSSKYEYNYINKEFGYSINSGNFYGKDKTYYVVSAPAEEANSYLGTVFIVDLESNLDDLFIEEYKKSIKFSEYFGSALAAGDINNDGFDDLIVGAPFYYTNEEYNVGRIYIYLGGRVALKEPTAVKTIEGAGTGAQFGATIQFLGDVDMDGYGDVAVAAPFEDDCGVVYIHKGNPSGLDRQAVQRIVGSDIRPKMQGFGMSISRPYDIDDNGCPDIGIGAPLSGHAVLVRTSPVLIINHTPRFKLWTGPNTFLVTTCVTCNVPYQEAKINISRAITLEDTFMYLNGTSATEYLSLIPNFENCIDITINLKKLDAEHLEPVLITISYDYISEIVEKQNLSFENISSSYDKFCKHCPVQKSRSAEPNTLKISLPPPCKNYKCYSSLNFSQTLSNLTFENVYVQGTTKVATLTISVANSKGTAYYSYVYVTIPKRMPFKSTNCNEKKSTDENVTLKCILAYSIEENQTNTIVLQLDMNQINELYNTSQIEISTQLFTVSQDANNATIKVLEIPLEQDVDFNLSGESTLAVHHFRKSANFQGDFRHSYQIESLGITDRKMNATFALYVPRTMTKGNVRFLVVQSVNATLLNGAKTVCYNENMPTIDKSQLLDTNRTQAACSERDKKTFLIDCKSEGFACSKIVCHFESSFKEDERALIFIDFHVDFSVVKDYLEDDTRVVLKTDAEVVGPPDFRQSGNRPDRVQVILCGDFEKTVALWIWVVAALIGALLLILLSFALIKAGFFKRSSKEDLEKLKKEVCYRKYNELLYSFGQYLVILRPPVYGSELKTFKRPSLFTVEFSARFRWCLARAVLKVNFEKKSRYLPNRTDQFQS